MSTACRRAERVSSSEAKKFTQRATGPLLKDEQALEERLGKQLSGWQLSFMFICLTGRNPNRS